MATIRERVLPTTTPFTRLRTTLGGEMLAEFFGTFILVMLGDASVALAIVGLPGSGRQVFATTPFGPANWLIIVWGWAFAVAFGVWVAGGISGAHINPAVTLAFALRRGFAWARVVPYWFAQVTGAFCGGAIVYAVYWGAINWYNTTGQTIQHLPPLTRPHSLNTYAIFATFPAAYWDGAWPGPFVDQIVGTAILVALIAALIDNRNLAPKGNTAALMIGLVVAVIGLTYGTNAGYAINPARDFGPRLFAYALGWGPLAFPGNYTFPGLSTVGFNNYWWIPIAGPLAGGMIGILAYDFFIGQVLTARAKLPGEPPPEPGRVPEPEPEVAARAGSEVPAGRTSQASSAQAAGSSGAESSTEPAARSGGGGRLRWRRHAPR